MLIDLITLVQPRCAEEFLRNVWGRTAHCSAADATIADRIYTDIGGATISELLRLAREPVLVMHYTKAGSYRSTPVSSTHARDFFDSGSTLYFDLAETAAVRACVAGLSADLGIDRQFVRVSIFASPPDASTEWHIDANENFTVQLTGAKRWLVCSSNVANPMQRFTATGGCPASLRDDESALRKELTTAPERACVFDMNPGSTLYVPRGAWHRVLALSESVSLNICIMPETWAHVVLEALRRRMLADPAWRELATGVRAAGTQRAEAETRLRTMMTRLEADTEKLTTDEVFS